MDIAEIRLLDCIDRGYFGPMTRLGAEKIDNLERLCSIMTSFLRGVEPCQTYA